MNMPNLDHIIPDLRALAVPLDDLKLDPANARAGHALDRIAASLHRYGQRKPIVVNRSEGNKIEAGNGTWQAARSLGWTHIAAVFVEDDPMTAVGYGIADNRLGDLSEWDAETLQALVAGLDPEMNLPTGFDDDELADMLAELGEEWEAPPAPDEWPEYDETAADSVEYLECPECGHKWPK